jgi:CubicO group peptidase (beta-lactamase class C family)
LKANAASSLHSTASDYARFMIALMNGTGLKPATAQAMLTQQVQADDTCKTCTDHSVQQPSQTIGWGLGVGLQHTGSGDSFWHWGDNGNFRCLMVGYPKLKKGIAIFTNSNNGLSIAPQIAALAMGENQPLTAWIKYEKTKEKP